MGHASRGCKRELGRRGSREGGWRGGVEGCPEGTTGCGARAACCGLAGHKPGAGMRRSLSLGGGQSRDLGLDASAQKLSVNLAGRCSVAHRLDKVESGDSLVFFFFHQGCCPRMVRVRWQ